MTECPVCGYDPEPKIVRLSDAELRHKRILNIFSKNLQNTWWLTQPELVCRNVHAQGVYPRTILDVGCGDGRWLPGILKIWPYVDYTGIDSIGEYIEDNKERMPDIRWVHKKIADYQTYSKPIDMVLLGGTLQERAAKVPLAPILDPILAINPRWILLLMDKNTPWESEAFSLPNYSRKIHLPLSIDAQGDNQDVWMELYANS